MTPELRTFLFEYALMNYRMVAYMASRGTRYSRDTVRAYQQWYNDNLTRVHDVYRARASAGTDSDIERTIRVALGAIGTSGVWDDRTAFRASIFMVRATVPSNPVEIPAWWARREPEYAARIDQYACNAGSPVSTSLTGLLGLT